MPDLSAIIFGAIAYTLCAAAIVGLVVFLPLHLYISRRLRRGASRFERDLDVMAQQVTTLHDQLPPSVFLKPVGDEAALALTWTSAMAALMRGASSLLFRALHAAHSGWAKVPQSLRIACGLLLTILLSIGTEWLVIMLYEDESLLRTLMNGGLFRYFDYDYAAGWVFAFAAIVGFVACFNIMLLIAFFIAVLLVALLAAVGAGMPSIRGALYMRMYVEAIPAGSYNLVLLDVTGAPDHPEANGLAHSTLYNHSGAIRAVIEAIEAFQAARGARPSSAQRDLRQST